MPRNLREALHPYPDDLTIATKAGLRTAPTEWPCDRPCRLSRCIEASLRRLKAHHHPTLPIAQHEHRRSRLPTSSNAPDLQEGKMPAASALIPSPLSRAARPCGSHRSASIVPEPLQPHLPRRARGPADLRAAPASPSFPYLPLASSCSSRGRRSGEHRGGVRRACHATPGQVALAWLLYTSPGTAPTPGTQTPGYLAGSLTAHG